MALLSENPEIRDILDQSYFFQSAQSQAPNVLFVGLNPSRDLYTSDPF